MDEFQLLWRNAPVAVSVARDEAVLCVVRRDMLHPLLHGCVVLDDRLLVAELVVKHLAAEEEGGRPCNIVGIVVPESRSNIRNTAVLALCLADVVHPLGVEGCVVEDETLAQRALRSVAQPRLTLVALRAVYRHSLVVAAYAPVGILVNLIKHVVVAGKAANGVHLVVDYLAGEIGCLRSVFQACYLNKAEAVVDECWRPLAPLLLAVGNVCVGTLGIAQVGNVKTAVLLKSLGKAQADCIALGSRLNLYLEPSGHVLSHVDDVAVAAASLEHALRLYLLHNLHARRH